MLNGKPIIRDERLSRYGEVLAILVNRIARNYGKSKGGIDSPRQGQGKQ